MGGGLTISFQYQSNNCVVQHMCGSDWISIQPCLFLSSDPASSQLGCFVAKKCRSQQETLYLHRSEADTERENNVSTCWMPHSPQVHCCSGYRLNAGSPQSFCLFKKIPLSHSSDVENLVLSAFSRIHLNTHAVLEIPCNVWLFNQQRRFSFWSWLCQHSQDVPWCSQWESGRRCHNLPFCQTVSAKQQQKFVSHGW